MITVAELIEKLQQLPQDAPAYSLRAGCAIGEPDAYCGRSWDDEPNPELVNGAVLL